MSTFFTFPLFVTELNEFISISQKGKKVALDDELKACLSLTSIIFLGYEAFLVQYSIPTFRRHILLPSSELKFKKKEQTVSRANTIPCSYKFKLKFTDRL